jgi:hypothetical protein
MLRRRFAKFVWASAACALGIVLCSCTPGGQFDPTELVSGDLFNTKKKLQGDREALFPNGVPGAETGVPPDLVKGYQPPPEQAAAAADTAAKPVADAAKPKAKPKPKPKPALAKASPPPPTPQPANSSWPAPPQPTSPQTNWPPVPGAGQSSPPAQTNWPPPPATAQTNWPPPPPPSGQMQQGAQQGQSIWPNPPAPAPAPAPSSH